MSRQNIYDNDAFFENFQSSRSSDVNFNDCIETPILFSMLPDLHGKKILDIGCGMGQHARQYSDMGAASVLGIDLSAKMLEYAKEHNSGGNVFYRQMAMEDIDTISETFDLVTSSLVFDYAEDFPGLMRKIHQLMKKDAEFVFSMSHPIVTAWDGVYDRYTRTETGERLYANLRNYCREGLRKVDWVVNGYECYHRTVSSLINGLIGAGFVIEECQEAHLSDEMRARYPALFGGTIHRPEFIFFRCRKKDCGC
jgi:2-polyprenyl-3-methyl-5-hydroxy-6-metoxy-1,4-benzoquinol methylase